MTISFASIYIKYGCDGFTKEGQRAALALTAGLISGLVVIGGLSYLAHVIVLNSSSLGIYEPFVWIGYSFPAALTLFLTGWAVASLCVNLRNRQIKELIAIDISDLNRGPKIN